MVAEEPALPAEDPAGPAEKSIEELFNEAYTKDPIPDDVLGQLRRGQTRSKQLSLAEYQEDGNGRLLYRQHLYVPNHILLKLCLIKEFHEVPAAGHPSRSNTLKLLSRQYYWPRIHKDMDRFLCNCHTCQRSRTSRHAPFGILRPLPIPNGGAWHHIAIDFITGLLWSNGFNAILVVVCWLTKMQHFIPCRDTCTAEQLAELYACQIF